MSPDVPENIYLKHNFSKASNAQNIIVHRYYVCKSKICLNINCSLDSYD